jgi:lysophospholipase L1-like esterase
MVTAAKAKGMEVILVKQQGRNGDATRSPLLTGRWFGGQLDTIGSEQGCQVIDLFNLWQDYCLTLTTDEVTALYMDGDTLHPNRQGAIKLAELVASQINFGASEPLTGAVMDESAKYMFKNVNSGLYMEVAGGTAAAGTNVQQWGANGAAAYNTWQLKASSDGYYYIKSMLGDGQTYFLDLSYGKADNGTNIGIYTDTNADAQLFKFVDNGDGSYTIVTKSSSDKSAVEVISASTESGANVQEWELNGNACQKWYAEKVEYPVAVAETTEPVPATTEAPAVQTEPATFDTSGLTVSPSVTYLLGDADCDGSLTINDAVVVMCNVSNSTKYPADKLSRTNGDIYNTGDGLDNMDALEIQKALAGIIELDSTAHEYFYAVDAEYNNGVTETVNSGFTGDAYINLDNSLDSDISWVLNAEQDGNYLITFEVANGSADDRKMKIEVNGESDYWMQSFLTTGSWTEWAERGIVLPLKAGLNLIKLTSATSNGGPNFDYLRYELTEEPIAETYVPEVPTTTEPDNQTEEDNPVIYIAGDSTVQSYRASYAPQQGWGYYLGDYFTDNVTVSNHAIAGRSSKSFYDNGRLDTILNSMKEGDYLLVQFGINDSASSNAERYAPVCGNAQNPTEGSFEYYLEKYITGALEKGGTPIMVTTVIGLKAYSNGKFVNSYSNYCQAMKDMAAKYNIPCIDLNSLMVDHYNSIGYDAAYYYHLISTELSDTDMTHFTETGANAVAGLVANAIKGLNLPVSQYVK